MGRLLSVLCIAVRNESQSENRIFFLSFYILVFQWADYAGQFVQNRVVQSMLQDSKFANYNVNTPLLWFCVVSLLLFPPLRFLFEFEPLKAIFWWWIVDIRLWITPLRAKNGPWEGGAVVVFQWLFCLHRNEH
jgi:hypothetical protein